MSMEKLTIHIDTCDRCGKAMGVRREEGDPSMIAPIQLQVPVVAPGPVMTTLIPSKDGPPSEYRLRLVGRDGKTYAMLCMGCWANELTRWFVMVGRNPQETKP